MRQRAQGPSRTPCDESARRAASALTAVVLLLLGVVAGAISANASATSSKAPTNLSPPRITGTAQVGQILRAGTGRWRRERGLVLSYQWQICDQATSTCTEVTGATDRIYPVRIGDADKAVAVVVTATNGDGSTDAASRETRVVTPQETGAPTAELRPAITGETEVGSTLTADAGRWTGETPTELTFRWRRCTALGGACVDLRQSKQTYELTARDRGRTVRVLVLAENDAGTGASLSEASPVIGPTAQTAPTNTSPPRIDGVPAQDRTLTASTGSWNGSTPMRFVFQWRRCDSSGSDCSSISKATRRAYTLSGRDVGRTLRVRVTARNAAGSASATSDHTGVVTGSSAPENTVAPTISGVAREGSVLSASSGSWKGEPPITFRYRWFRCGADGNRCRAIRSANTRTRALTSTDVGRTLRMRVTATNDSGSSAALSAPTGVVAKAGIAPANKAAPVLSGVARQGERLRLSTGSWTGTEPLSFSYRWERCDGEVRNCVTISGVTASSYVLVRADVGHRVFGVVTVRNAIGSSNASSNASAVIVGAPVNAALPKISGTPREGQVLSATSGSWTGVGPITFGYQWTRCDAQAAFSSCTPIVVTSRSTYTLRSADVGNRVFVQVKAKNAYGASYVNSDPTDVIAAAPIGTVTLRVTQPVVVFGHAVTLVGRIVGAPAGERVTIVERPVRGAVIVHRDAAVVGQSGVWSYRVRPSLGTSYEAKFRDRTSTPVRVLVRPRLLLRKTGRGRVSLRVFADRSLAGKRALLQRWNARKHRWVTTRRVRLRPSRYRTVAVVTVRTHLPRGTAVRFVVTGRQAGAGYMTGWSNRVRSG